MRSIIIDKWDKHGYLCVCLCCRSCFCVLLCSWVYGVNGSGVVGVDIQRHELVCGLIKSAAYWFLLWMPAHTLIPEPVWFKVFNAWSPTLENGRMVL